MPYISVIIPVFNSERTISFCVQSVLDQTISDFELIIIDDGSTDNCPQIIKQFSDKHPQIKYFRKENEGVSATRQYGLSQAAGDYILFIDSDDWIESSTLETFKDFSIKKEYDVIVCDHYIDYGIKKTYHKFEVSDNLLENIVIHGGGNLFTKFISRQYIIDNKIQFEKDMDRFEDLLFCISIACNHPKWAYIPKAFYHYCQYSNPNSLMKKPHNSAINYQRLRNNCPTIPTDIQDYLYANEAMATLLEDLLSYHDFSKQFKQLESKSYPIAYWPLLQTAFKGHIHYSISRGALICIIKIKELIKHILSKI